MLINSSSLRCFISRSVFLDAGITKRLLTVRRNSGWPGFIRLLRPLDEGGNDREEVEHDPEDLGVAEVELEHPGCPETGDDHHADLRVFRCRPSPGTRTLSQEESL